MEFSVSVPSDKIKLLLGLIKKVARTTDKKSCILVYFTTEGAYAIVDDIHICVPFPLSLGIGGFVIDYAAIETLSKAEGDIVFSTHNDNALSPFDVILLSSMVYSDKAESQSDKSCITYFENGTKKEIDVKSRVDVVINLTHHCMPKNTITSTKFLSVIAMCAPYCDKDDGSEIKKGLSSFCLEGDNIIAVDGRRLIVAKNIDIDSLAFCGDERMVTDRFLLQGNVSLLLPKSGSCQLAPLVTPVLEYGSKLQKHVKKTVGVLYIGFPDYFICVPCVSGRFPNWKSLLPEHNAKTHKLHIDTRDAQACIKQLKTLPKREYRTSCVHLHFEDGRLCADSQSADTPNIRLRFSEHTTGSIASETGIDIDFLGDVLRVATEMQQNSGKGIEPLHFESDIATIIVMAHDLYDNVSEIASVVELEEHWKSWIPKPVKRNGLFVEADKDKATQANN